MIINAYLKYGPCRPEPCLAVDFIIQTENSNHLVSWAAQMDLTAKSKKTLTTSWNWSCRKKKSWNGAPGVFFILQSTRPLSHSYESKGGRRRAQRGPSATAPAELQLQSLINWMLRFHVWNPRDVHHLRVKAARWRHQRPKQDAQQQSERG